MRLKFLLGLKSLTLLGLKNKKNKLILRIINFSIFISIGCFVGVILTGYMEYKSSILQEEYNAYYTKRTIINSMEFDYTTNALYHLTHTEKQFDLLDSFYDTTNPQVIIEFVDLKFYFQTYGITSLMEKLDTQEVLFNNEDEILQNTAKRKKDLDSINKDINKIVKDYKKITSTKLNVNEVRDFFKNFNEFKFKKRLSSISDGANADALRFMEAIDYELERLRSEMKELNTLSSQIFYFIFIGQILIFLVFQSFDVIAERRRMT